MKIEKTVLLVDDDQDDVELLEEVLKLFDGNHQIKTAKNGEDGLAQLENMMAKDELPCLIVLDINMPRMDGRQTFLAIKSNRKLSDIPVVIFSTSTSLLDRVFFERHHTAYFIKPVNFSALTSTAAKMITHCQHRTRNVL
jgi:CheY-like chemotaxis protein